jgi:hypothetical protein
LSQTEKHNENPELGKSTTPSIPSKSRNFPLSGAEETGEGERSLSSPTNNSTSTNSSPFTSAIDTTIQRKDPRTWPDWYRKIKSGKLFRYVIHRQICCVTPETLIPGELIRYDGPQTFSPEYKLRLAALGIPFRDEQSQPVQEAA